MKRILTIVIILINSLICIAQIDLHIEGLTYTNSDASWSGVNIARVAPTLLVFKNNSITSINTVGYMLQSGDDSYSASTSNNLDNALISGNQLDWNGTPGATATHGIMAGYNLNYTIKYNYIDGPFYGIVNEGGYNDGASMVNTSGGIYYNIFRNCPISILVMGYENVNIYNNVFYLGITPSVGTDMIRISVTNGTTTPATPKDVKIRNNIFYCRDDLAAINIYHTTDTIGFRCDYNIYYFVNRSENKPRFIIAGSGYTWDQWRALGYDSHSQILNPNFIDTLTFVPTVKLEYGTNLGATFQTGLDVEANWIVGSEPKTTTQGSLWQVGAIIYSEPVVRKILTR